MSVLREKMNVRKDCLLQSFQLVGLRKSNCWIWMGDHLVVPHAKFLFFSIAMLISHDIAATLHFAKDTHFKGIF